jgi:hypothetical protein
MDDDNDDSPIRFKGLLSMGVDPISDTLVVSSTASLMETISELDKAAEQSSSVQIPKLQHRVDPGTPLRSSEWNSGRHPAKS